MAPPTSSPTPPLRARLEEIGRKVGAQEGAHQAALGDARRRAESLQHEITDALAGFHAAAAASGAPHLQIDVSPIRLDDKHVRAVEFELRRGRHVAIVTVKSRGDVTLVGPFRAGKTEGPCLTFPFSAERELADALGGFLERFLDAAVTP